MKLLKLLFLVIYFPIVTVAQPIEGDWKGTLRVPGTEIPLILHISKKEGILSSQLDSPSQSAKGIAVAETTFEQSILNLNISVIGATYQGKYSGGLIEGDFKQNGQIFALKFMRNEELEVERPQVPKIPLPYRSEEVKFENPVANIRLAGTFTAPSTTGKFPVVVLISGSGAQNRDEEIAGHKPFLVLSDHLTRNGIAVLRFDDRGTGASTGNYALATSADLATDVRSAVDYLKSRRDVDLSKIGLVGHSEGGLIASMLASESKDIAYVVLLAGPGVTGERILIEQSRLIGKVSGTSQDELDRAAAINSKIYAVVKGATDNEEVKVRLTSVLREQIQALPESQRPPVDQQETFITQQVRSLTTPWFRYFLTYDPASALTKVKCPLLALNGSNDLQVPADENLSAIGSALAKGGNSDFTIKSMPGLNHLFQESKTGAPSEYSSISQTFSPAALNEISGWILKQL